MVEPHALAIVRTRLFAAGFEQWEALAQKIVQVCGHACVGARACCGHGCWRQVFTTLSAHLSPAEHYDFGLRSMCAVVSAAAQARAGGGEEAAAAAESLVHVVGAAALSCDRALLNGVVRDAFPSVFGGVRDAPLESVDPRGALVTALRSACEASHLGATPSFLAKCTE